MHHLVQVQGYLLTDVRTTTQTFPIEQWREMMWMMGTVCMSLFINFELQNMRVNLSTCRVYETWFYSAYLKLFWYTFFHLKNVSNIHSIRYDNENWMLQLVYAFEVRGNGSDSGNDSGYFQCKYHYFHFPCYMSKDIYEWGHVLYR